jgi:curved DNA-binding protein CbpA
LATHPDKGGNPSDFHRVSAAYSELADPARRAAYDRTLDFFGRKDGIVREDSAADAKSEGSAAMTENSQAVARVALARMMARNPNSWGWYLSQMKEEELNALYDVLQGSKIPQSEEKSPAKAAQLGKVHAWIGPACISHHKSGYKVSVTWSSFCVTTGFTKILAQAIDWQIALLRLCSTAQARMKRDKRQADTPVTDDEVLQVLKAEPSLELLFSAVVELPGKRSRKISGPAVQDLAFTLDIRSQFLKAAKARNPADGLERQRRQAEKEAVKSRQAYKKRERALLAATARQMHSRRSCSEQERSGPSSKRKRPFGGDIVEENSMQSALAVYQPQRRVRGKMSPTELMLAGNCLTYNSDGKTYSGKFNSPLPLVAVMGGA